MLRITINETPSEQEWTLQGKIAGPWAVLLTAKWDATSEARRGRTCTVNLNDVTFVDDAGEEALRTMRRDGAELKACGLYTSHLVGCCGPRNNLTEES
jgi:hypothetical protein